MENHQPQEIHLIVEMEPLKDIKVVAIDIRPRRELW